ncbi:MAG: hypothetical protein K0R61_6 [Microvirga sp.]|jgi:hypothetical protein|nr:hypothetical protein [Microvirga sp.]MDF2969556.1 hypothetical protein [Microvirga sp.]
MSNINDMGLPQGLPEMLREVCPRWRSDDGKVYEYNPWFHSYREVDEHREMTAADLGLRDFASDWRELHRELLATNAVYRRLVMGDAPYAFWLGAEG